MIIYYANCLKAHTLIKENGGHVGLIIDVLF